VIKKLFVALACACLTACVTNPNGVKYTGSDAGAVILSMGESAETSYNSFAIHLVRMDGQYEQRIWWGPANSYESRKPDYYGDGKGIVEMRNLPPGDYEVYNFDIYQTSGMSDLTWNSKTDFSLKFHVGLSGKNLLDLTIPAGGYWIVSDRSARDIPIAHAKNPMLPRVRTAVVDPALADNPLIRGP